MTKEQKFKKQYSFELLQIAEGDLETTQILFQSPKGRKENVCFNAQQVVEKSIKAVLCYLEIPIPFTHNLDILIDRLPSNIVTENFQYFNELTEYATIRRYEEGNFELDKDDLEAAVNIAQIALQWAQDICKTKP